MRTSFWLGFALVFTFAQGAFSDEGKSVDSLVEKLPKKPAQMKIISKEPVDMDGQKYLLVFKGYGEFCDYDQVDILQSGKKIGSLKKRCGRDTKLTGDYVLSHGKFASVVKIGPTTSDVYLYLYEEPSNYQFKTSLFQIKEGILKTSYSGLISGSFSDRNGDGLLDITKEGGRGEPSGKGNAYDPYLVYVQSKIDGGLKFYLDESLSMKLSKENNFEWHGKTYNEKLLVNDKGQVVR